jgi:hypothetical protein
MPKRIKEKIADTFLFASLGCGLPQRQLRGYFLNAGAKVPQDHKQWLLLNSLVVCHDTTCNQAVLSGGI